jgi:hypothetical protein
LATKDERRFDRVVKLAVAADAAGVQQSSVAIHRIARQDGGMYGIPLIFVGLMAFAQAVRFWPRRCPRCGKRKMRFVGLAAVWTAEWIEHRFPEAHCRECDGSFFRKNLFFGTWQDEMPY